MSNFDSVFVFCFFVVLLDNFSPRRYQLECRVRHVNAYNLADSQRTCRHRSSNATVRPGSPCRMRQRPSPGGRGHEWCPAAFVLRTGQRGVTRVMFANAPRSSGLSSGGGSQLGFRSSAQVIFSHRCQSRRLHRHRSPRNHRRNRRRHRFP